MSVDIYRCTRSNWYCWFLSSLFSFIPLIRNIWILLIFTSQYLISLSFSIFTIFLNLISYCSYFLSSPYFGLNLLSLLKFLKMEVFIIAFFQSFFLSNNKSTNTIIFLSEHWFWSICQLLLEKKIKSAYFWFPHGPVGLFRSVFNW